jgi:hypothetical protein
VDIEEGIASEIFGVDNRKRFRRGGRRRRRGRGLN